MSTLSLSLISSATAQETRFKALAGAFCEMTQSIGIQLEPYSDGSLSKFRSLPPEIQTQKLAAFETYFRCCERAVRSGIGLSDGISLLKAILKDLGLHINEDTASLLTNAEVIEVYRNDLTQLFRNLRFLEICSYPLMDLYVHEISELYRRPHVLTDATIREFTQVLTSTDRKPLFCDVPDHFLEEIFSPGKHKFYIRHKLIAPVMNEKGEVVAAVSSLWANLLLPGETGLSNVKPLSP